MSTTPTNAPGTEDLIASICHEANRVLQRAYAEPISPPWDELDDETRMSAIDGVRNAQSGSTPEKSHKNWMRFKLAHGWIHGPLKDTEHKTHPCLVDYSELPEQQRVKDRLFIGIVRALSGGDSQ